MAEQTPDEVDCTDLLMKYSSIQRTFARTLFPINPVLGRISMELFSGLVHLFDCLLQASEEDEEDKAAKVLETAKSAALAFKQMGENRSR